jgi:hypothetical protein
MRINLFLLLLAWLYCSEGYSQQRDSTMNTDTLYYQLYSDTSDAADWTDTSNSIFVTTNQWIACRDKKWDWSDREINLCNENPYVLIFHDDFKKFDENMWFTKNSNGFEWDGWNSDGGEGKSGVCLNPWDPNNPDPEEHEDYIMSGQQLYLRENVKVENENLIIATKPLNKSYGWIKGNSHMWPWGPGIPGYYEQYFNYSSGRAQTSWAFSRGENWSGGGIIVEARIKVPDIDGLWPAFWLMSPGGFSYDEFDIFEFMENDWHKLKMTIHAGTGDAAHQCREENKLFTKNDNTARRNFFDDFHTYTFLYTDYSMAVFLDNKLQFQKHHTGRRAGISHFDCQISKGEFFGQRVRYCNQPMRIIFNTHVYCSKHDAHPDPNTSIDTKMEVEYVNVWQKLPCKNSVTLKNINDLPISDKIYNVISAKKVIIDMQSTPNSGYHIDKNRFLKIIANDTVLINGIEVSPLDGRFEVEITDKDLCSDAFDFKNLKVNRRSSEHYPISTRKYITDYNKGSETRISVFNSTEGLAIFGIGQNDITEIKLFDVLGRNIDFEIGEESIKTINIRLKNARNGSMYFITILDKKGVKHAAKFYYGEN